MYIILSSDYTYIPIPVSYMILSYMKFRFFSIFFSLSYKIHGKVAS